MKKFYHTLLQFISQKKGSVLGVTALALTGLVTITGGAIDTANYMNMNTSFRNSIDNAITSAIPVIKTQDVNKVVEKFFYANFPAKYRESIKVKNIKVKQNPKDLSWTVSSSADMQTSFAKFIGISSLELNHTATVSWDTSKKVEVVFTLDTSASMCMDVAHPKDNLSGGGTTIGYTPDYTCKKLKALKEAMNYVIDEGFAVVMNNGNDPLFSVGVIPFNHKINFPDTTKVPPLFLDQEINSGFGSATYYSDLTDAEPLSAMVPLRALKTNADRTFIKNTVNNITQSPVGLGWTRSNIATLAAATMLDPVYYNYYNGSAKPDVIGSKDTDKIVVMMTDGANIGCCYASHPEGNYSNQYLYLYEVDNIHLAGTTDASYIGKWDTKYSVKSKGICQQMKENGFTVFSVVFDVDDNDPGGKEIKDAYRGCASKEDNFFDAKDSDELKRAYKTIAQSLLKIRITY